ncbi:GNAT family N-acetyltransferase [Solibacillus sp. R5-41]|uniref:GNAT family N-acetyltransferase n=1 Tax=Solibacillus sp. R5-41 TaxID=2048654 RepID=UPI000C126BDF|nr:GNAT family N-acetyltransferase [Solibacillus sp. R5-41]ATP38575.1 GNAT family N-acetyltransferase [Solibacillus sp. R5-41]
METQLFQQEIPKAIIDGIQQVHRAIFDGTILKEEKLQHKVNLLAVVVLEEGIVAGFKLGYEQPDGVFYSWLGGVHPQYQQRGIAMKCMTAQHEWCKQQGYSRVRTYGRNERKAMLIVNIKAGFEITSTFIDAKGRHKVVFEKAL